MMMMMFICFWRLSTLTSNARCSALQDDVSWVGELAILGVPGDTQFIILSRAEGVSFASTQTSYGNSVRCPSVKHFLFTFVGLQKPLSSSVPPTDCMHSQ